MCTEAEGVTAVRNLCRREPFPCKVKPRNSQPLGKGVWQRRHTAARSCSLHPCERNSLSPFTERKGTGKGMVTPASVTSHAHECTATKPSGTVVKVRGEFRGARPLPFQRKALVCRDVCWKLGGCWTLPTAPSCRSPQLALQVCCREAWEQSAPRQRAQGDLVTTARPHPQPCSAGKPPLAQAQGPAGQPRPAGPAGGAAQVILPQAGGSHLRLPPAPGSQQLRAGGSHLPGPAGRRRVGRAGTQVDAALLSDMAPQASLRPSTGELPPPPEPPDSASLGHLSGPFPGAASRFRMPPLCRCRHCPVPPPRWRWLLFLLALKAGAVKSSPTSAAAARSRLERRAAAGSCSWGIRSCSRGRGPRSRRWSRGERGMGAARGGGGRESKFPLWQRQGVGRNAKGRSSNFTPLMDLFRRSTAVGGYYPLGGRQCSKVEGGKATVKTPQTPLFNSLLTMWLV